MMKNILEYRGYFAKIEYSVEDQLLYGKIEGINDLVNFESDKTESIEQEFHLAVDEYLELCRDLGKSPDKAYSGTFNVRIHPELHRAVALQAIRNNESLNNTVEKALQAYVYDSTSEKVEKIWNVVSTISYAAQNVSSASYNSRNSNIYSFSSFKREGEIAHV